MFKGILPVRNQVYLNQNLQSSGVGGTNTVALASHGEAPERHMGSTPRPPELWWFWLKPVIIYLYGSRGSESTEVQNSRPGSHNSYNHVTVITVNEHLFSPRVPTFSCCTWSFITIRFKEIRYDIRLWLIRITRIRFARIIQIHIIADSSCGDDLTKYHIRLEVKNTNEHFRRLIMCLIVCLWLTSILNRRI
jgi:hypothetical protein